MLSRLRRLVHGTLAACAASCMIALAGCGYDCDIPFTNGARVHSVLGDGSSTIKIEKVDHVTLYPWVSYYLRGVLRDEINLRRLGRWVDQGEADYLISAAMPGFRVRSAVSNREDSTLLNASDIKLEISVRNGRTGALVWQSGVISYEDWHEVVDEGAIIRNGLTETTRRALDLMQQKF